MLKVSRIFQGNAANVERFLTECMRILDTDAFYTRPRTKIVNRTGTTWLGRCLTSIDKDRNLTPNSVNSVIELQKIITEDDNTLKRVVAHECCHHATYSSICNKKSSSDAKLVWTSEGHHGPIFFQMAAKINAVFGADFVTKQSDENFVLSEGKPVYLFLWKQGDKVSWSWSARPSAQQIAYITDKVARDPQNYKLIKSTDHTLQTPGGRIGDGSFSKKTPEGRQMMLDLFNSGTDISSELEGKHPSFTVILTKKNNQLFGWKIPKMTPKLQQLIRSYSMNNPQVEVKMFRSQDPKVYDELGILMSLRYDGRASETLLDKLWMDSAAA